MTRQFKLSALAALAAICVIPSAFAQTVADTGGGGATLPAKAYHGSSAASDATEHRLSEDAAPGSLFHEALYAAYGGEDVPTTSYCQVGSGTGRRVLEGVSGYADASLPCPSTFADSFVTGTNGFSAPNSDADFAGSDAPGTATDFSNYVTNKGTAHGQMTQFPSVAGLISVVYSNSDISGNVFLTEAELCNIFAGKITNWNQLVNGAGKPYDSKTITLVYRSDNSGTSFNFSNHLNWVCQDSALNETLSTGASTLPFSGSSNFTVGESMAAAFPGGSVPSTATAIAVSGNPAVISKVMETDGAIGYAETANVLAVSGAKAARIAAIDTVELSASDSTNTSRTNSLYKSSLNHAARLQLPTTFTDKDGSTQSAAYTDRALQANSSTYGRPVGTPTALTSAELPQASNCVFFVHPGAFATSQYVTSGSPSSGYESYPIVAVTYLMGNYNGNASTADARTLLGAALNYSTLSTAVTSVGANTGETEDSGYYWLRSISATTLSGGSSTLNQSRVDACTNS